MLGFIEGPESAIALTIAGTITDEDLEGIMDRLDIAMITHGVLDLRIAHQDLDFSYYEERLSTF